MRINDILAAETPVFSFEFFPPKTQAGEQNLYSALSDLKALQPSFVSVTYGAGGSSREQTIEIVKRIKEQFGLEAMAHFTCVGASVPELRETLDEMREAGIDNVLALRGDPPDGESQWTKTDGGLEYSRELVQLIGADYDFAIGAACFPETHIHAENAESDLRFLAEKVDAGVDFLITQMFFDNDFYFDFVARARAAGITAPIIPGVMPITRVGQVERMAQLCGSTIPDGLSQELHARADDAEAVLDFGVAYATLQCAELLAAGAPGIHFYTLNRSPATRAILSALKLARPWERAIYPASISRPSATRGEPSGAS
ncbi:MAG TPA: methylenetetrahydrofolate reductase [NAD(P)H] [Solirubrobacteraceae bacterium]|jgi:methylenetetrahydrofolate reductase (NADPH)|nr:methylenetetrahydrofolate reductase [NAD(P)H] [Solirubrobacteraceae bacterium]